MAKKIIEIPDDMTSKLAGAAPSTTPVYSTAVMSTEVTPKKSSGRPKKESSVGRVKYTTSLTKESIRFLRVESAMRDISPADLLEIIINDFGSKKG